MSIAKLFCPPPSLPPVVVCRYFCRHRVYVHEMLCLLACLALGTIYVHWPLMRPLVLLGVCCVCCPIHLRLPSRTLSTSVNSFHSPLSRYRNVIPMRVIMWVPTPAVRLFQTPVCSLSLLSSEFPAFCVVLCPCPRALLLELSIAVAMATLLPSYPILVGIQKKLIVQFLNTIFAVWPLSDRVRLHISVIY